MKYSIISTTTPVGAGYAGKELRFEPNFKGSGRWARNEPDLGRAAFTGGKFRLSDFSFLSRDNYFYKDLTVPEWENRQEIERLVKVAQAEIEAVMDKLIAWVDIAEVVKRAKAPLEKEKS